jgi:hypothetical protein
VAQVVPVAMRDTSGTDGYLRGPPTPHMSTAIRSFVIVRRDAPPPALCFKCGTGEGLSLVPTHFYTMPDDDAAMATAEAAGVFVSAIGDAANIASFVKLIRGIREAVVPLPLCGACASRWKSAKRARFVAFAPFAVAIVLIFVFAFAKNGALFPEGSSRVALYAFAAVVSAVLYGLVVGVPKLVERRVAEPATCSAVAIAPAWIALSRVHPRVCAALIQAAPIEARMMLDR